MWIFTFQSKNIRVGEKELREEKKNHSAKKATRTFKCFPFNLNKANESSW